LSWLSRLLLRFHNAGEINPLEPATFSRVPATDSDETPFRFTSAEVPRR
jgi:hypothetical protein